MLVMKKVLYNGVVRWIVDFVNDFWVFIYVVKSVEFLRCNYLFVLF